MNPENNSANARRIMVVDDNEIILQTMALKLRRAGYHPLTARDGGEALTVARQEPLDLVLLDINFPPDVYGEAWDGFRVLEWLRQLDHLRDVPVVIISGSNDEADRVRALKYGAVAFFHKPIDHADLLRLVQETLEAVSTGKMVPG